MRNMLHNNKRKAHKAISSGQQVLD